eukprot:scaffold86447_cov56-Phaeocystis_antarctica.AAC.2
MATRTSGGSVLSSSTVSSAASSIFRAGEGTPSLKLRLGEGTHEPTCLRVLKFPDSDRLQRFAPRLAPLVRAASRGCARATPTPTPTPGDCCCPSDAGAEVRAEVRRRRRATARATRQVRAEVRRRLRATARAMQEVRALVGRAEALLRAKSAG